MIILPSAEEAVQTCQLSSKSRRVCPRRTSPRNVEIEGKALDQICFEEVTVMSTSALVNSTEHSNQWLRQATLYHEEGPSHNTSFCHPSCKTLLIWRGEDQISLPFSGIVDHNLARISSRSWTSQYASLVWGYGTSPSTSSRNRSPGTLQLCVLGSPFAPKRPVKWMHSYSKPFVITIYFWYMNAFTYWPP